MFSRVKNFFVRHRTKFIVSGVLIGGTVLATRYAQRKLTEFREREAREFLEMTRKRHHFESTEQTCNRTIAGLLPSVLEQVTTHLNTAEIVNTLRKGTGTKLDLWEELKIITFSQITALAYANAMLATLLRIQLNIIGASLYRELKPEEGNAQSTSESPQDSIQHVYLSLCKHFIDIGLEELCHVIKSKVRLVLENVSLKKQLSVQDTEQIFWAIQTCISNDTLTDPIKHLAKYILPPRLGEVLKDLSEQDANRLKDLTQETNDLLDSEEVQSLSQSCINRNLSAVIDHLADAYTPPSTSSSTFVHPNTIVLPLAKVIPIVNGITSQNNSWAQNVVLDEKLRLFGANVYESFCQG